MQPAGPSPSRSHDAGVATEVAEPGGVTSMPMSVPEDLRQEQLRALAYVRKRGTLAPLAAIRARVAGTYTELEALVESVPAEVARARPADAGWSVQEVVDHLVESERPAAAQLESLLAGRDVDEPIPAGLLSDDPLGRDWPDLQRDLRTVHENVLDQLSNASDDVPLEATAPVEMVVKCEEPDGSIEPVSWVQRFDWKAYAILLHAHNREHLGQIHRVLAEVSGDGGAGS